MKTTTALLFALCVFTWSCNNSANTETKTDTSRVTGGDSITNAPPSDNPNTTISTDAASSSFLMTVANVGMAEVQLGETAQAKATNQSVKDFGAMMVHDHTAANDKVKSLASQRSVSLPTSVDEEHQKMIDDLNKKSGKAFDKSYIDGMVKGHEKVIKAFNDAAGKVSDTEVKAFINNTLPTLQMHLDSAKAIQKRVK